jgi:hypothetical protein
VTPALFSLQHNFFSAPSRRPCEPLPVFLAWLCGVHLWMRSRSSPTLLCFRPCTPTCTGELPNSSCYHGLIKADLRISINDYQRKELNIPLRRMPLPSRQVLAFMNGSPWPKTGLSVSLTRLDQTHRGHFCLIDAARPSGYSRHHETNPKAVYGLILEILRASKSSTVRNLESCVKG